MPKINETSPSLVAKKIYDISDLSRSPMRCDLGLACFGAAQPVPDISYTPNFIAGLQHRVGRRPPKVSREILRSINRFVRKWCKKNLVPLTAQDIPSFDEWLTARPYTQRRKAELRKVYEKMSGKPYPVDKDIWIKAFIKDECYDGEYKVPRGIFSRDDAFKVYSGPIFSAIEARIYNHPAFIKHIPVPDRPSYISRLLLDDTDPGNTLPTDEHKHTIPRAFDRELRKNNLPRTAFDQRAWRVYASDYSSFESHFTPEIKANLENIVYDFLCSQLPHALRDTMAFITRVLSGDNRIVSKFGIFSLLATRMSGEMNTSCGNGISNLLVNLYVIWAIGGRCMRGVVEGDDGLFRYFGPQVKSEYFKMCGWTIKIGTFDTINDASFCGIVFDELDGINVTNPISGLLEYGWGSGKYAKLPMKAKLRLLRAKSLSLLYSYPGCPILQSLALAGLRITTGMKWLVPYNASQYEREEFQMAIKYIKENGLPVREVPQRTRNLVERLYGITVESQIEIEKRLDSITEPCVLRFPELEHLYKVDQISTFHTYVYSMNDKVDIGIRPALVLTQPLKGAGPIFYKYFRT